MPADVLHVCPLPRACRQAYNTPWGQSTIRYVGDGRPFWRHIVFESTACCNEQVWLHCLGQAWRGQILLSSPGAHRDVGRLAWRHAFASPSQLPSKSELGLNLASSCLSTIDRCLRSCTTIMQEGAPTL